MPSHEVREHCLIGYASNLCSVNAVIESGLEHLLSSMNFSSIPNKEYSLQGYNAYGPLKINCFAT
jgi:hypothetical protein